MDQPSRPGRFLGDLRVVGDIELSGKHAFAHRRSLSHCRLSPFERFYFCIQ